MHVTADYVFQQIVSNSRHIPHAASAMRHCRFDALQPQSGIIIPYHQTHRTQDYCTCPLAEIYDKLFDSTALILLKKKKKEKKEANR